MDLFAPSHIVILLVVILVLFGAKRLPGAAKSLGESMHIFKKSVQGLNPEDHQADASTAAHVTTVQPITSQPVPPPLASQPANPTQQQLDDIQRQLQELQRLSAGGNGAAGSSAAPPEPQRTDQTY